ncbi:alpha-elapitoxin-As2a-like [Pseudoliparis swirei]|uniref:alpha-elapitoxin-As2a-like n=1 Tax=Pseudoliparis swirei TaxID=2059687 RepID=UPI0024BDF4EF|nr:alpha-elapitoxin-As2a-like [Pseudoliparis swirei]
MGKTVFVIIAVLASFMLADSLICNKCKYGMLGYCLSTTQLTCKNTSYVCFTGKASFTTYSSASFNTQGCMNPAGCNETTSGSLVGLEYNTTLACCSTDKCNPLKISSGASSAKMSLTAAIGVAVLASMCGSFL